MSIKLLNLPIYSNTKFENVSLTKLLTKELKLYKQFLQIKLFAYLNLFLKHINKIKKKQVYLILQHKKNYYK